MLSQETIRQWATKWQTTELNVMREYYQHLLLSSLYQLPVSEKLAFKGGTALRIAFGSPRFSEDLDFTANITTYHLNNLLHEAIDAVRQTGIEVVIEENKSTSGGHLTFCQFRGYGHSLTVSCNFSFRKKASHEVVLITTPLTLAYQCLILNTEELVSEKIQALLDRKKPRDFFDLYFLLRQRKGLASIVKAKKLLLSALENLDAKKIQKELKFFLPVSHQRLISSLSQTLGQELAAL